ncbi:MAG: hypothetical protein ACK40U_10400, partial [Fervidobacterium pennivorans]
MKKQLTIITFFLIISLILPFVNPVFATEIFSDGFESGDFSAWTGTAQSSGTVTVVTENPHHGTYSAKAVVT